MKMLMKYFLLGFLATAIPASAMAFQKTPEPKILSSTSTPIPVLSFSPTPTARPVKTPVPKPTKSPVPTQSPSPTPSPISSEEIMKLLEGFAGQYAVDPNVLRHIAICESGFNPSAVNGSYVGLYQFGPITWASNRILIGEDPDPDLRYSAEESIQTAAYMLATKGRQFWPNCKP